jgi:hypothetical protein
LSRIEGADGMLIEENYEKYIKDYNQFLIAQKSLETYNEELGKTNLYRTQIESKIRTNKKVKWDKLEKRKREIQTRINALKERNSFTDDEKDDELFVPREYFNYERYTWWDYLDKMYIEEAETLDALNTQLENIIFMEEHFEQDFEMNLQKILSIVQSPIYDEDYENEVKRLKNQLLTLKTDINQSAVSISDVGGVLKKYFYFTDGDIDCIEPIYKIEHNNKPLVFLYDDTNENVEEIYDFMDLIIQHIIEINPLNLLQLYINFYGMDVSERQMYRHIQEKTPIENIEYIGDVKELANRINDNIEFNFNKCKKTNADVYNEEIYKTCGENSKDFLKWSILQMYIPKLFDNDNEKMNVDILDAMEDGMRYGFIPVYYISESEWNNEERKNIAVSSIKEKIQKTEGKVYRINLKEKKIKDYPMPSFDDDVNDGIVL